MFNVDQEMLDNQVEEIQKAGDPIAAFLSSDAYTSVSPEDLMVRVSILYLQLTRGEITIPHWHCDCYRVTVMVYTSYVHPLHLGCIYVIIVPSGIELVNLLHPSTVVLSQRLQN